MRWNAHINSHFGSCRLLATGYDPHRHRHVKYYALPGDFDNIGITDGTDSWVAPAAAESESIKQVRGLLNAIRDGKNPEVRNFAEKQKRHAVDLDAAGTGDEFKPRPIRRTRLDASALL